MGIIFHLIAFSFLASGVALALGAFMESKHALTLWRSRPVKACDVRKSTGIFDVRGPVHTLSPLTGPLTGRSCVQYTVVVERTQPKGNQKRDGAPDLITFVEAAPFVVDDGTGRIHVDLRLHRVPVTGTAIVRQPIERLTAQLERMLSIRLHKPGGIWCTGRDIIATEAALIDGDEVSVIGRKGDNGEIIPVHVTTGKTHVVAMQGLTRAGFASIGATLLFALYAWLR